MPDVNDLWDIQPRSCTIDELEALEWGLGTGIAPVGFLVHVRDDAEGVDELRVGDGVTFGLLPLAADGPQVGRYKADSLVGMPYTGVAVGIGLALTANTLYAVHVPVPRRGTFANLVAQVSTFVAGTARVGVYRDGGGQPGRLVLDAGTFDLGTNGQKTVSLSSLVLGAGPYWLVLVGNSAATVYQYPTQAHGGVGYNSAAGNYTRTVGLTRAFTFGALPADESAATYSTVSGPMPALFLGF